jgi:hypothetical protein
MRRRPLIAVVWIVGLVLAGLLAVGPQTAGRAAGVTLPAVLDFNATAGGVELHLVPGEYRGTLDSALIETAPFVNATGDTSPTTSATAGVINTAAGNHYPDLVCLLAPPYYCPYARALPVNSFFARAYSGTPVETGSTSFPCRPGEAQDKQAAVAPPDCSGTGLVPAFATGEARATVAPAYQARALAQMAPTTLPSLLNNAPPAAMLGAVTTLTELTLDPDGGVPVAHSLVTFSNVTVGGVFHADAIRLETSARTLGEEKPRYSATVILTGVTISNVTDPAEPLRQQGSRQCNDQLAAAYDAVLKPAGLVFYCSRLNPPGDARYKGGSAPVVDTNPATGYGLNPVFLELLGPGFDYAQGTNDYKGPAPPCLNLDNPGQNLPPPAPQPAAPPPTQVPLPGLPPGVQTPVPPPPYLPPPAAKLGTSCDYVSSNTFRGQNAMSLRFGHITQFLAAGSALPSGGGDAGYAVGGLLGSIGALTGGGGSSGSVDLGSSGASAAGGAGGSGHRPRLRSAGSRLDEVVAGLPLREWLLYGYGAWGTLTTAMLCMWALRIPRRLGAAPL